MNTAAKLAAFAAVVAVTFGGAMAVGNAVGPIAVNGGSSHSEHRADAAIALPKPSTVAHVDGYTVTMAGTPTAGDSALTFTVEQAGSAVRTDPYLGAAGHLVAIRVGDLAYLHVRPNSTGTDPAVSFVGEFPTAGTYRLFFDFSHNGTVHTAAFTVEVSQQTPDTSMAHSEGAMT